MSVGWGRWGAYRQVWSVPGAAGFSSVGALARLPQAMAGLGAVVMITGLGGSYTVAGAVAGVAGAAGQPAG